MIAIIDYGMGNVASVKKALDKLGASAAITREADVISQASHIILPGVGAFGDGIKNLHEYGLVDILRQQVIVKKVPFLGICLGLQLLAEKGYEYGEHQGLGWIQGETVKLAVGAEQRLPHVGWDNVNLIKDTPLFAGVSDLDFYFVHSYYFDCQEREVITARCNYGVNFLASLQQDNIFGTQFHPEKSQISGLKVLENFINYCGHA